MGLYLQFIHGECDYPSEFDYLVDTYRDIYKDFFMSMIEQEIFTVDIFAFRKLQIIFENVGLDIDKLIKRPKPIKDTPWKIAPISDKPVKANIEPIDISLAGDLKVRKSLRFLFDYVCERSSCADNTNRMYPSDGLGVEKAKKLCMDCKVRRECGELALLTNEQDGVWGCMSERARNRIRRQIKLDQHALKIASLGPEHPIHEAIGQLVDIGGGLQDDKRGRPSKKMITDRKSGAGLIKDAADRVNELLSGEA